MAAKRICETCKHWRGPVIDNSEVSAMLSAIAAIWWEQVPQEFGRCVHPVEGRHHVLSRPDDMCQKWEGEGGCVMCEISPEERSPENPPESMEQRGVPTPLIPQKNYDQRLSLVEDRLKNIEQFLGDIEQILRRVIPRIPFP